MEKTTTKVGRSMAGTPRPPIVVVLGHVDHGKTTLLDKIRSTNIAARETGGITQHIGAYQVEINSKEGAKKITFIDTPGHAAFAKMRGRGAKVADLAVLVVSGEESVKPQTIESLKFIQEAKINYLVAVTKTDLPNVDLEKIKNDLMRAGILLEGMGGEIVMLPVSAKTGKGIDDLLEMILLLADLAEIKGNSEATLEAVVIESKVDTSRGPVATVIIRNGCLQIGEEIYSGNTSAKIKAMFDEWGKPVKVASPGQPVEVLGFKQVPIVGELLFKGNGNVNEVQYSKVDMGNLSEEDEKKLRVILKTDTVGTLEAIINILPKDAQVIKAEPGNINESDILDAKAYKAKIFAFRVKISGSVAKLAETEHIKIRQFETIYQLVDKIEEVVSEFMNPEADEEAIGKGQIIAEFVIDKKDRIAGVKVIEGQILKSMPIHLEREAKTVATSRIKVLKKGKIEVDKVTLGEECGISFQGQFDFTIGDMILSFRKLK